MHKFTPLELKNLYQPDKDSSGEDNGQVTIIGGSELFHGAPFFAIQAASRIVDMVFFSSPHGPFRELSTNLKSKILSFIWVPFEEIEDYIKKSDAVLIGPGFMRARTEIANQSEACDEECKRTKNATKMLLGKFPDKKWVIDAGSLQVMDADWIPENAVLTPNKKEYKMLFGDLAPHKAASKYNCIIVIKGPVTNVYSGKEAVEIHGGNAGMTKGGTGDIMAGLTVALLAKNEPFLSACAAAYIVKASGDELHKKQGIYFSADDLADQVPKTFFRLTQK